MRRIQTIKIDDREFTVKELTVRDIWGLKASGEDDATDLERLMALACPELTRDVAFAMAPSELKVLWQVFREVNADFLEIAAYLGIDRAVLDSIKGEIAGAMVSLMVPSAASSAQATGP